MKARLENDLIVIGVASVILALVILFLPSNVLRIVIGVPFLLFFPGYTLVAALFPRQSDLDGIERVALSFGLSIAVVPLSGLVLNYTWEISLYPILVSLGVFLVAASAVAWYRRRRLSADERFTVAVRFRLPAWQPQSRVDKILSVFLVVAILGAIGVLSYVMITPRVGERFTEFYILGLEGKAELYPGEFLVQDGEVVTVTYEGVEASEVREEGYGRVTLGIVNREHEEASYGVRLTIDGQEAKFFLDGEEVEQVGPKTLVHEEEWEQGVGFAPSEIGDGQKVEFLLYKDGELYEGQALHLWVDVRQAS